MSNEDWASVGHDCAVDNSQYRWTVDRRDYSDTRIRYVTVTIESLQEDGTWAQPSLPAVSFFGT